MNVKEKIEELLEASEDGTITAAQGYSDRTTVKYTMTFPMGYNAPSLIQENLIIKRVVPENYDFGQTQIESPPAIRFVFTIWNGRCVTYCAAAVAMFRLSEKL